MIITAAAATELLGTSARTQSKARVDSSGVKNDNRPMCLGSPRFSAASHR